MPSFENRRRWWCPHSERKTRLAVRLLCEVAAASNSLSEHQAGQNFSG
jgi:hypothetical protein